MSIFLHLHEIAAMRGDGLRPELIKALQGASRQDEVIALASEHSKPASKAADSRKIEQLGDWTHRMCAK